MQDPNPTTRYSVISRVLSHVPAERHQGLTEFAVMYYPFIRSQVSKYFGALIRQDREDVCQHVLKRACEDLIFKYDRLKGGFRKWFATVISTESLIAIREIKKKREQAVGISVLANQPTIDPNEEQIQRECLMEVLRQMRDFVEKRAAVEGATSKWQAFALVYFRELAPADFDLTRVLKAVAAQTGKTVNAVSIDCCRVRAILRQEFGDALED